MAFINVSIILGGGAQLYAQLHQRYEFASFLKMKKTQTFLHVFSFHKWWNLSIHR